MPRYDLDHIPPDREDGSSSLVHHALVITGRLGRVPALALLPLWIALAALVAWSWGLLWTFALAAFILVFLADWAILALLPIMGRSWGPVTPSLLGLSLVHALIFWSGAILISTPGAFTIVVILNVLLSAIAAYATWIEPFRIRVVRHTYPVPAWKGTERLRIIHVSDLHFEGNSPREAQLLRLIDAEAPDFIWLTGDYLNLSSVYNSEAQQGVRRLLAQLTARYGVYAVTGSPVVDVAGVVPEIFDGLPIVWLDDRAVVVEVGGQSLWLLGVRNTYNEVRDTAALTALASQVPPEALSVLLYHTPDLMPVATELGVDLYLCGHTHGGQLRLPLYGALATSSRWGKRYEQGRYRAGGTTLYVSMGLGVEGLGAPRARFLAQPEIIVWDFTPDGPKM